MGLPSFSKVVILAPRSCSWFLEVPRVSLSAPACLRQEPVLGFSAHDRGLRRLQGAPLGVSARHRPAVATYPLGSAGLVMTATMFSMAITSAGSAESIVVSSLAAFDVHQTYINPEADGGNSRSPRS
jgi:hypothetical protein